MKTEEQKSDIKYKNRNPKLSMKVAKTGYRPAGAGSVKTESVKTDPAESPHQNTLKMKTGATAHPLHKGNIGHENKVTHAKHGTLVSKAHAGAHGDPSRTTPTWNTRKGRKAKRYK